MRRCGPQKPSSRLSEGVLCAICVSELRGLLARSASQRGTLQGNKGYVVLLLPVLPYEGIQLLYEEVSQRLLLAGLGDEGLKPGEAKHLTYGAVSLYQPVAVGVS